MGNADKALNLLRERIGTFHCYGGKDEKEISDRLKVIGEEKYKIANSMFKPLDKKLSGHSTGYKIPVKGKIGKFDVVFTSYYTLQTPEEKTLTERLELLKNKREQTYKILSKKLNDISLKVSISGLDAETTQLLKDFLSELERIEN